MKLTEIRNNYKDSIRPVVIVLISLIIGVTIGGFISYSIDSYILKNKPLSFISKVSEHVISPSELSDIEYEIAKSKLIQDYNEGNQKLGILITDVIKDDIVRGTTLFGLVFLILAIILLKLNFEFRKKIVLLIAVPSLLIVYEYFSLTAPEISIDKQVIQKQMDPNTTNNLDNYQTIEEPFKKRDWVALKKMINNGADVNVSPSMLYNLIYELRYDIAVLMIEKGADPNSTSEVSEKTALMAACENNNLDLVNLLILKGADINRKDKKGKKALDYSPNQQIASLLVNNGTDWNLDDFYLALQKSTKDSAELMIAQNPDIVNEKIAFNGADIFLTHCFQEKGKDSIVTFLIEHGANVNAQDNDGNTLLHKYVQYYGDGKMISFLLMNGADKTILNNQNQTPEKIIATSDKLSAAAKYDMRYLLKNSMGPELTIVQELDTVTKDLVETQQVSYKNFANDRFSIDYPESFKIVYRYENDQRIIFSSSDGKTELEISGIENVFGDTPKSSFESDSKISNITYKAQEDNWHVVSWISGDNIVYLKRIIDDSIKTFKIEYPLDQKDNYDPIVLRLSSSFK